jgi:effector-binding domain-containing protein
MTHGLKTLAAVTTKKIPSQRVAAVRVHTSMATIGWDIGAGFRDVSEAITAASAQVAGPPFILFLGRIDDVTDGDIEVCFPVALPFVAVGNVFGDEVSGGEMACIVHRGPYDEIAYAYAELMRWMEERDRHPAGPPREVYLNEPGDTKPEDLLTEIEFPIS